MLTQPCAWWIVHQSRFRVAQCAGLFYLQHRQTFVLIGGSRFTLENGMYQKIPMAVRLVGVEPTTPAFVVQCSNPLSYKRRTLGGCVLFGLLSKGVFGPTDNGTFTHPPNRNFGEPLQPAIDSPCRETWIALESPRSTLSYVLSQEGQKPDKDIQGVGVTSKPLPCFPSTIRTCTLPTKVGAFTS